MKTPQQAILWELWRTGRSDLMLRVISLSLMVVLFDCMIATAKLRESALQPLAGIAVLLLMICGSFSSVWLQELDTQQTGFGLRLGFTRPVSTGWLVTLPMLYSIVTSFVCYLIPAALFGVIIGTSLPVHVPALLTAMINAGCLSAMWSSRSRAQKVFYLSLLAAVTVALVRWYIGELPEGESWVNALGAAHGRQWNLGYDGVAVAAVVAMIRVTVMTVDCQRHEIFRERVLSEDSDVRVVTPRHEEHGTAEAVFFSRVSQLASVTGFDNRWFMQAAYEFRRAGFITLLAGVLLPLVVLGVVLLIPLMNPKWDRQPLTWLVAIIFCPLIYQLIGIDSVAGLRGRQGRIDISPFDLIRPLRNDQLTSIKLIVVSCTSLAGWLIMLATGAIYMVVCYGTDWFFDPVTMWRGIASSDPLLWLAGFCCLMMSIICSSTLLLALAMWMPLYPWRVMIPCWAVAANCVVVFIDWDHGLRFRSLWTAEVYAISFLIPLLSALILRRAWSSGTLGASYLVSALILWGAWLASGYWLQSRVGAAISIPFEITVLEIGLLPIPLVTMLTAPVAYAVYRHR